MTSLGPLTYRRARYRSGASGSSPVPVDESLGLVDDYLTRPAAQLGLLMMGHCTAREAAAFFAKIGGMTPSVSTLQRLTRTMHERWETLGPECCSASSFDPPESLRINTLPRRSASKLRAEQQADAPQAGTTHQSGDPLAAHSVASIDELGMDAGCAIGSSRDVMDVADAIEQCPIALGAGRRCPALATRSTRWWRPPAAGTSWRRDRRPGWLSRTRRPGRDRAGCLREPGRGFCQYLALLAQPAVLVPEPPQLLALGTGQAVMSATLVPVGLADPVADRLSGWLKLPSQLLRRAARANQLNHLLPETG